MLAMGCSEGLASKLAQHACRHMPCAMQSCLNATSQHLRVRLNQAACPDVTLQSECGRAVSVPFTLSAQEPPLCVGHFSWTARRICSALRSSHGTAPSSVGCLRSANQGSETFLPVPSSAQACPPQPVPEHAVSPATAFCAARWTARRDAAAQARAAAVSDSRKTQCMRVQPPRSA